MDFFKFPPCCGAKREIEKDTAELTKAKAVLVSFEKKLTSSTVRCRLLPFGGEKWHIIPPLPIECSRALAPAALSSKSAAGPASTLKFSLLVASPFDIGLGEESDWERGDVALEVELKDFESGACKASGRMTLTAPLPSQPTLLCIPLNLDMAHAGVEGLDKILPTAASSGSSSSSSSGGSDSSIKQSPQQQRKPQQLPLSVVLELTLQLHPDQAALQAKEIARLRAANAALEQKFLAEEKQRLRAQSATTINEAARRRSDAERYHEAARFEDAERAALEEVEAAQKRAAAAEEEAARHKTAAATASSKHEAGAEAAAAATAEAAAAKLRAEQAEAEAAKHREELSAAKAAAIEEALKRETEALAAQQARAEAAKHREVEVSVAKAAAAAEEASKREQAVAQAAAAAAAAVAAAELRAERAETEAAKHRKELSAIDAKRAREEQRAKAAEEEAAQHKAAAAEEASKREAEAQAAARAAAAVDSVTLRAEQAEAEAAKHRDELLAAEAKRLAAETKAAELAVTIAKVQSHDPEAAAAAVRGLTSPTAVKRIFEQELARTNSPTKSRQLATKINTAGGGDGGAQLPADAAAAKRVIMGYLLKKGQSGRRRWQRRYFLVKGHYLLYYESKQAMDRSEAPKASIDLGGLLEVRLKEKDPLDITIVGSAWGAGNANKYELRAEHKDDHEPWAMVFQRYLPKAGASSAAAAAAAAGAKA